MRNPPRAGTRGGPPLRPPILAQTKCCRQSGKMRATPASRPRHAAMVLPPRAAAHRRVQSQGFDDDDDTCWPGQDRPPAGECSARMHRLTRSPLALMALTVFIDITGFGLVIPLLPFWAERLGAGPAGVGLALTLYALAQFLFTPALGALSDRHGRRPIILASLLIEALAFALTALAGSF